MTTKDGFQPLQTTADFNRELMQVKTDDDAKVAAAAVLSLYSGSGISTGAVIVSADQVKVEKSDKGWTCTATRLNSFQGTVGFNPAGKVISVNKVSIAPLPPSIRPRQ
jgi:hypothetical protein